MAVLQEADLPIPVADQEADLAIPVADQEAILNQEERNRLASLIQEFASLINPKAEPSNNEDLVLDCLVAESSNNEDSAEPSINAGFYQKLAFLVHESPLPGLHNDQEDYKFYPGVSLTSILYRDDNGAQQELLLHPNLPCSRLPLHAPVVWSSSNGLLICGNWLSNFCIVNPDLTEFTFGCRCLPAPPKVYYSRNTCVVLAIDLSKSGAHVFHVICAVCEGPSTYIFDTYSSSTDAWVPGERIHMQQGLHPLPNTGVSCGRFAYWLTERSVLRYDVMGQTMEETLSFIPLPECPERARMQLGRVRDKLNLVIVDEVRSRVVWYALHEGNVNEWERVEVLKVVGGIPRPIRFESFKMEMMFWREGEVLGLERNASHPSNFVGLQLQSSVRMPVSLADGLPYVRTFLLPDAFRIMNQIQA